MVPFASYLLALVTVFTVIVFYVRWLFLYWKRRNTPYFEPSFPFGNLANPFTNRIPLPLQITELYRRFREARVKLGGIYLLFSPVLLVTDPEHIKQVLIKDFRNFHGRGFYYDEKHDPFSVNLFTVDGEKWRALRLKYSPAFTSTKIKSLFDLMKEVQESLERHVGEHVAKKEPLHVNDCIARVSSNTIGSCVFGIDCNSFVDPTFQNILLEGAEGAAAFVKVSFCNTLPSLARFLRIPLIPRKVTRYISNSIEETIDYRRRENAIGNDFLQQIIEMKDNGQITMDELKSSCALFFLAGFESTTVVAVFTVFELAYNQEIQENLRKEINKVLAEYNGEMTYESIGNIKYLEMIICEALRKYPPVAFLNRKCSENYQLSNSHIIIEKGTDVMIPVHALQNDPRYFPDPDKFDPERFSEENEKKIVPFTYMPFGDGPRRCIGDRFAKQEIRITIASLVRKYRFKLRKEIEVPLRYKFSGILVAPAEEIFLDVEDICE